MGNDYTMGVKGIAAVNAIEIINCFGSTETDLARFRKWVDINTQIKDRLESLQQKPDQNSVKLSAKQKLEAQIKDALDDEARERTQEEIEQEYLHKHRNLRKHWVFPDDFPNFEVIKAFKKPNVDQSKDTFTWGNPEFDKIRTFAQRQLNWRQSEVTKYVDIVEKRVLELKQKRKGTLENYFKAAPVKIVASVSSNRIGQAMVDLKHKRRKV